MVAYDFGIKTNILRRLASFGCRITVVPATYPASEVLKMNPDGVFFSNGPVSAALGSDVTAPGLCLPPPPRWLRRSLPSAWGAQHWMRC